MKRVQVYNLFREIAKAVIPYARQRGYAFSIETMRWISLAVPLVVLPACGGGSGSSQTETLEQSETEVLPPSVTTRLETENTVTARIGKDGGRIETTGNDGSRFQLDIPVDALIEEVEIKLTPVAAIGNLPLDAPLLAAVQFEPEGLAFITPGGATLTIEPAKTVSRPVGIGWQGNGEEFHLQPVISTSTTSLSLDIQHFSGAGVIEGEDADLSDASDWGTSGYEMSFNNKLAVLLSQYGDDPFDNPVFQSSVLDLLREWYRFGVLVKVDTGENADAFFEFGFMEMIAFLRAQMTLGFIEDDFWGMGPNDPLANENANLKRKLINGYRNRVERIVQRCEVTEDAVTYLQEALQHSKINSVVDLMPPPEGARADAILPHFEGRCISVEVTEIESPVWMPAGETDRIDIWTAWRGPSGEVKHDNYPVGVELEVTGASLSSRTGITDVVEGKFTTDLTMQQDEVARITVRPFLGPEGLYYGKPYTFTIGECEPEHVNHPVWPAIFDGDWNLTLNITSTSCDVGDTDGSSCRSSEFVEERVFRPRCGQRIATGGFGFIAIPGVADVTIDGNTISWSGTGTREESNCDVQSTYRVSMTGSYSTDGDTLTGSRRATYTGACYSGGTPVNGSWQVETTGTRVEEPATEPAP